MQNGLHWLPLREVHSCTFLEDDGYLFVETSTILYAIHMPEMNACKAESSLRFLQNAKKALEYFAKCKNNSLPF
jgi:hypothetical protein